MTKYILAGGNDRSYDEYGEELSRVVRESSKGTIKILSCQFAKNEEDWLGVFESWKMWFSQYFGSDTQLQLASPEKFLEQITWADVIYLHGGHTHRQEAMIKQYKNLEEYFKGKIVVGSSAGANYLSKTYYSPSQDRVGNGSGIVPLNTVVHYGASSDGEVSLTTEEWEDVVRRMKSIVGDEELTLIPEGKFVVFEK